MFKTYDKYGILSELYRVDPYQMWKTVNDLIAHGADVDDFLYNYTPFDSEENWNTIYRELQAHEADYKSYSQAEKQGEETLEEVESTEILQIYCFNPASPLGQALQQWHHCKPQDLTHHIRSGYWDETTGYIFYVTGTGYDTASSDLLGKEADGKAVQQFRKQYTLSH